jgi:NYN domain
VGAQLTLVPPKRGSQVDVVLAVQLMEAIPDGVERIVFASLDRDLVAVIPALKRAGIYTILLSPPDHVPLQLALAADELIDMTELSYVAEGLISPGAATKATRAITEQFARATTGIVIIDPYIGRETISLLVWVPSTVDVIVVGSRIEADAVAEAGKLRAHGRRIRVV